MTYTIRKRCLTGAALLIILMQLFLFPYPVQAADTTKAHADLPSKGNSVWPAGPKINGSAAIVMDVSTGLILYEKDIYSTYYPASTTKILTSLVAIENSALNEIVSVSYEAEWFVSKLSSRMGLVEGEQLTMEEALYGIMLESANEATYAVGEHVGGSIAKFVKMMNTKAKELGCVNTNFANSHGLHDDEHYTCAYDLAVISKAAIENPIFRKITATSTYAMPATNKNPERLLTNHHKFITKEIPYDYAIGGKTGATTMAKYALVTYAKKDGMTLIAVVMHAENWDNVYSDSATILDFAFDNYSAYHIKSSELAKNTLFPSLFNDMDLFAEHSTDMIRVSENSSVILPNGIPFEAAAKNVTFQAPEEFKHGDNIIGTISYTYEDRVVGTADILYYNTNNPMTTEIFNSKWPGYMIPVEAAFSGKPAAGQTTPDTSQSNETAEGDLENPNSGSYDIRPLLLASASTISIILLGMLLIFRKPSKD